MGIKGRGRRSRPKRLAEKLRTVRESLGLTQLQMPQALKMEADVSQGMVSTFESNIREPSLIVILAYARLGSVTVDSLIDDESEIEFIPK